MERRKLVTRVTGLLSAFALLAPAMENTVNTRIAGDMLEVAGRLPAGVEEVELRLESSRNSPISKFTDISPLDPSQGKIEDGRLGREIFYPVVDVELQPGMEAVVDFSCAPKTCTVNYQFHGRVAGCGAGAVIPPGVLEFWENSIFVEPASCALRRFYLRQTVRVLHGQFRYGVRLLSPDWQGTVSLHARRQQLAATAVNAPAAAAAGAHGDELSTARLKSSLESTLGYLIRSQNQNPLSPTRGVLHLFYDLDASTYRSSYWMWGSAPTVRLLLDAPRIPGLAPEFRRERLEGIADDIGRGLLRWQIIDPSHPARGVPVSRWDRGLGLEYGFRQGAGVADGNFVSAWAWIPLYERTRHGAYMEAAKVLADATERLLNEFGVPPQDYYHDLKRWSEHILDESGFGVEGLAELYRVTKEERYRKLGQLYVDRHLERMQRDDGLWHRRWKFDSQVTPVQYHTRGLGWAMEGLLAADRLLPGGRYQELAKRMAEHLMRSQQPDGCWTYNFNRPREEVGISEKGTALWSLLFYRLYATSRDPRHLATARKALAWCVRNQYAGPDPQARGGVVGVSPHSAVGYRPWFRVTCAYTSAFFGMAAIEELTQR